MEPENLQPSFGAAVHLNVRCLVGLHGLHRDDDLDEAFSAILEDASDEPDLLNYALASEDADRVQFLVGSQSLKPHGSQVTLVTVFDGDEDQVPFMHKKAFSHPDGEVTGLTVLPAQPDWFISTYASYAGDRPELRSGARVWRLPNSNTEQSSSPVGGNFQIEPDGPELSTSTGLDYVTTLPLDRYAGIRNSKGHISTPLNAATSQLVLLSAPSQSSSGDYRESASAQLCLPPSSNIFTSHLKTNVSHLFKTMHSTGTNVAITSPPSALRWSTYQQCGQLMIAFESGVLGWDIRSMKPSFWLEAAHWPCVRDLDCNPHRPTLLATGGDDGCIRLWDLRYLKTKPCVKAADVTVASKPRGAAWMDTHSATEPLYSVQAHSHWVWSVRYHPTRDQLLLSAGSDCRVCLYSLNQFSSDAVTVMENGGQKQPDEDGMSIGSGDSIGMDEDLPRRQSKLQNGLIARLEQHEESVYAVDWSPVDPWFFASVSYDGNLLVNQVPESVKLNILLQVKED